MVSTVAFTLDCPAGNMTVWGKYSILCDSALHVGKLCDGHFNTVVFVC